jgi:predicted nucleic acid-binding protein
MSAERSTYLDSSAIVKLAVAEPDSAALRRYISRQRRRVSSALARLEVGRALLPLGDRAAVRGVDVLSGIELVGVSKRVLEDAAKLLPHDLRTLDAIHIATAQLIGNELGRIVTYDERMAQAARELGMAVVSPA